MLRGNAADDRQRHPVTISFRYRTGVEQLAFLFSNFNILQDILHCSRVRHGAHAVLRIFRRPHLIDFGSLDQTLHEFVVDRVQNDHPRTGRAFLPLEAEGRVEHVRHRFVQIGIIVDNDGVLPPHLGDDLFDIGLTGMHLGGPFDDAQADLHRAGEGDQ